VHKENLSKSLLIRAPTDLLARIKEAAAAARQPVSWWIRDALEERLARVDNKAAAQSRRKSPAKAAGQLATHSERPRRKAMGRGES
jgi:predicted transcriptional regulator